jgi:putative FmdB family regulatory protein
MPIYGYICKSCEHTLDALQKMSDDPLVYCPDCGEPQLKRQLSAPRFRLKGKGWYETDFKTENQRNLHGEANKAKKDAKPASDSGDKKSGKASTKKESSSATKADAG